MALHGGAALKQAIHVARARTQLTSDMQLALRANVHYDTLMNWFGGRTIPRPAELKKVADALGISYGDLMAAYEGRDPEPQPLQDAIMELVGEIRALIGRLDRLTGEQATAAVEMMRALGVIGARVPPETPAADEPSTPAGTGR